MAVPMTPEEYEAALALRRGQHVEEVLDVILSAEKAAATEYAERIAAWIAAADPFPPMAVMSAGMTLLGR